MSVVEGMVMVFFEFCGVVCICGWVGLLCVKSVVYGI